MRWWLALNSYPQNNPQEPVDDSTLRDQWLTELLDPRVYLKDNLLLFKKQLNINKKINKKLKYKRFFKYYLAITMMIFILIISSLYEAKAVSQTDLLKLYAHSRIINYTQFRCFDALITRESHYNVAAKNGSHYGLGQMANAHYRTLDGFSQVDWSLRYITKRYGSMCNAWRHFKAKGWH